MSSIPLLRSRWILELLISMNYVVWKILSSSLKISHEYLYSKVIKFCAFRYFFTDKFSIAPLWFVNSLRSSILIRPYYKFHHLNTTYYEQRSTNFPDTAFSLKHILLLVLARCSLNDSHIHIIYILRYTWQFKAYFHLFHFLS